MTNKLNRRDFIKLLSLLPPAYYLPPNRQQKNIVQNADAPNFIVLVFDAWSAKNISLLGYPRDTTPNLNRLAEKAIVYHNHYAGGFYTFPGTMTLLSGVHPWNHQFFRPPFPENSPYRRQNIFGALQNYHRLGYTHNPLADKILMKMAGELNVHKPIEDLFINKDYIAKLFRRDYDLASVSWIRAMEMIEDNYANSLFLSRIWSAYTTQAEKKLADDFPLGLPKISTGTPFKIEDAVDWLITYAQLTNSPSLTYFHLLPPHTPYKTRKEFVGRFKNDGYTPIKKPFSFFNQDIDDETNFKLRRDYNEYILYVDSEINRLFSALENTLRKKNTWIIITSDHGEIHERGLDSHAKPSMYDPLVNIPLMIFPPNQQERIDIVQPTSAIDILPTITAIAGEDTPAWAEGTILPPFNAEYSPDRSIYVVHARGEDAKEPLNNASVMLRKGPYKLIHHFGEMDEYLRLENGTQTELFDLEKDPEELENLFSPNHPVGAAMLEELKAKLDSKGISPR